jgi:nicotinate phosphoribosyltransferase
MIVDTLMKNDLYKLSMLQLVLHHFSDATATYRFKCRNKDVDLIPCIPMINKELDHLCSLKFTKDELVYLLNHPFFKPDFIDFLEDYQLKRKYITVSQKDGKMDITIKGPILQTLMFEIYVLKIVHEVYTKITYPNLMDLNNLWVEGTARLYEKIGMIRNYQGILNIVDFGTRRAFDDAWHEFVIEKLVGEEIEDRCIKGTSNLYYAMKYNIPAVGTMAHEIFEICQAMTHPIDSQKFLLQKWYDEYQGRLGIALTDTLGFNKFLKDFNIGFARLYDGVRHDSGEPVVWGDRMIEHYKNFDIDPMTKTLVFSDGLDVPTAIKLNEHFKGKIKLSYGIGTNLTNDLGVPALQNVIKIVECNGKPVAKISDSPGKSMCESNSYINFLQDMINKEVG